MTRNASQEIAVCHIIAGAAWAGAEAQSVNMIRALSQRPEVRLCAIVLHQGRVADQLLSLGIPVYVAGEPHTGFLTVIRRSLAFLRDKGVSILHSHNYKENVLAATLSTLAGIPHLVRTEHGHPEPYSPLRHPGHWCVLVADRCLARWSHARILAVSADLEAYWRPKAGPNRVTVLRNAVDLQRVTSPLDQASAKQRLGLDAALPVIGIAGRLEQIKRHDIFVQAAHYIDSKAPGCRFIIVGTGSRRGVIENMIAEAGLQHCVTLLGERTDVYDVLRAMDIMLLCSDHEGIPMVLLEAMALGVVVAARKVGGIGEVLQDRRNGRMIATDDPAAMGRCCIELLKNPRLRAALSQQAMEDAVHRYSSEAHTHTMVTFYHSVCFGHSTGGSGRKSTSLRPALSPYTPDEPSSRIAWADVRLPR